MLKILNIKRAPLVLFLLPLLLLSGCRMNNGDIGALYGAWVLTQMEVDGEVYTGWESDGYDDTFFQFQNNICSIIRTTSLHDYDARMCTWQWIEEDREIELNYTHHDDTFERPGSGVYAPPSWLLLIEPGKYVFTVTWNGDRKFTWTTVNTRGQRLVFHLKKTY